MYTIEPKENVEILCLQMPEAPKLEDFYISVSGSDTEGQCESRLNDLKLETSYEGYSFVDNSLKSLGDTKLSYFKANNKTTEAAEKEELRRLYTSYHENAKVFA